MWAWTGIGGGGFYRHCLRELQHRKVPAAGRGHGMRGLRRGICDVDEFEWRYGVHGALSSCVPVLVGVTVCHA